MTSRNARRRFLALAIGVLVAAGFVGVAEVRTRDGELGSMVVAFDPPGIKYVLAPDQPDAGRGWREGATPPPRLGDVPRLVCVGDSVTYGVNVAERETFCEVVGRGIDRRTETFDFGMNGYDAEQVAALVDSRVAPWKPGLVLWGAYVNDVFPTYLLYGLESGEPVYVGTEIPEKARLLPEPLALFLVRHSALFRRIQGAAYARSERASGPAHPSGDWYDRQVDRITAWSKAQGIPVLALAIPPHVLARMDTCPQHFPVQGLCEASLAQYRTVTASLTRAGIPWVDGLAAFQASGQEHFHPPGRRDPDHPNAAGHRVLAMAALPKAREMLGLAAGTTEVAEPSEIRGLKPADGAKHPGGGRR